MVGGEENLWFLHVLKCTISELILSEKTWKRTKTAFFKTKVTAYFRTSESVKYLCESVVVTSESLKYLCESVVVTSESVKYLCESVVITSESAKYLCESVVVTSESVKYLCESVVVLKLQICRLFSFICYQQWFLNNVQFSV